MKTPSTEAGSLRAAELLPCPFCGGAAGTTYTSNFRITFPMTGRRAVCGGCGASAGAFGSEHEAVEAWNRRAALSAASPLPTSDLDHLAVASQVDRCAPSKAQFEANILGAAMQRIAENDTHGQTAVEYANNALEVAASWVHRQDEPAKSSGQTESTDKTAAPNDTERDAKRYRWLREHKHYAILIGDEGFDYEYGQVEHWSNEQNEAKVDAAIDAAMRDRP